MENNPDPGEEALYFTLRSAGLEGPWSLSGGAIVSMTSPGLGWVNTKGSRDKESQLHLEPVQAVGAPDWSNWKYTTG